MQWLVIHPFHLFQYFLDFLPTQHLQFLWLQQYQYRRCYLLHLLLGFRQLQHFLDFLSFLEIQCFLGFLLHLGYHCFQ